MVTAVQVAPGVSLWREKFSRPEQELLLGEVLARVETAPFYRPTMPGSGKPFSVEETNFGPLGWVSDKSGYRYQKLHPVTGKPWPEIPAALIALWREIAQAPDPECCLVNLYRGDARMGLHQDRDEQALSAPVVSVSLGDDALFRIGGIHAERPQQKPGAVLRRCGAVRRAGPARLSRHRPYPPRQLLAYSGRRPDQSHPATGHAIGHVSDKKRPGQRGRQSDGQRASA